jgi:hypothetical protein
MNWIIFLIIGLFAQLIDGTLGMGFGLTSSTLLLTAGASAAIASMAVHLAEIGTTLASGLSHWRLGNIDKKLFYQITIPGGFGAFIGANFLTSLDFSKAKIFISTLLFILGFLMIYRSLAQSNLISRNLKGRSRNFPKFLAFTGGFIDSAGGGGWGPIVTPTLISFTNLDPRKIVGTVNASEFVVAIFASLGFLLNVPYNNLDMEIIVGLAVGGILMAPIAAKIVIKLSRRNIGIAIGLMVIFMNGYIIFWS